MKTYTRIPLEVKALFSREGRLRPIRVHFGGKAFAVEKILSVTHRCPQVVACVAPVEYTLQIEGVHKKIYYEGDTGTWFSVRESTG